DRFDNGQQIRSAFTSLLRTHSGAFPVAFTRDFVDFPPVTTQLHSTRLSSGESSLRARADSSSFMLSHRSHDVNCELVGLGQIHSFKLDTGFHESRDKRDVACKPVQLRHQELRIVDAAECECACKLWSVGTFARFHFDALLHQLPASSIQVASYRFALCF